MRKRTQQRLHGKFVSQSELDRRADVHEHLREDVACDEADAAPSLPEPFGLWATLDAPLPVRTEFPMLTIISTCLIFATLIQITPI
jgi:hypothetical protein